MRFNPLARMRAGAQGYFGEAHPSKYSEHGLGHLSDPRPLDKRDRPLAADIWQHILDAELGHATDAPGWFERPAVTQRTISTPRILKLLGGCRPADSPLRPLSFCNHAILHPDEPRARDRDRFDLVAPYERDPLRWTAMEWAEAQTGESYPITTSAAAGTDAVRVKSIGDVVTLYRRKREAEPRRRRPALHPRDSRPPAPPPGP